MEQHLYQIRISAWNDRQSAQPFESLSWTGLRLDQLARFEWYFLLRAAHLRVKHPRAHHSFDRVRYVAAGDDLIRLQSRQLAKKREQFSKMSSRLTSKFNDWKARDPLGLSPFYALPNYPVVLDRLREILEEIDTLERSISLSNQPLVH